MGFWSTVICIIWNPGTAYLDLKGCAIQKHHSGFLHTWLGDRDGRALSIGLSLRRPGLPSPPCCGSLLGRNTGPLPPLPAWCLRLWQRSALSLQLLLYLCRHPGGEGLSRKLCNPIVGQGHIHPLQSQRRHLWGECQAQLHVGKRACFMSSGRTAHSSEHGPPTQVALASPSPSAATVSATLPWKCTFFWLPHLYDNPDSSSFYSSFVFAEIKFKSRKIKAMFEERDWWSNSSPWLTCCRSGGERCSETRFLEREENMKVNRETSFRDLGVLSVFFCFILFS